MFSGEGRAGVSLAMVTLGKLCGGAGLCPAGRGAPAPLGAGSARHHTRTVMVVTISCEIRIPIPGRLDALITMERLFGLESLLQ